MNRRTLIAGLAVTWLALPSDASAQPAPAPSSYADVEEVLVYLVVRSNRTPAAADPACDDAGFAVRNRNDSDFRALSLVTSTSRVDRNVGEAIGTSIACFSARSETGRTEFLSRMIINGVRATGRGECVQRYTDFPEARVGVQDCWLKLENVSSEYVGGFLTTNTVATRLTNAEAAASCAGGPCGRGLESDPPGYVLPAVATLRLWKKR